METRLSHKTNALVDPALQNKIEGMQHLIKVAPASGTPGHGMSCEGRQGFAVWGDGEKPTCVNLFLKKTECLTHVSEFPFRRDGCRGPLYLLPPGGLAACSLYDELFFNLAWCEWCRTFICGESLTITVRGQSYDSGDCSGLSCS